MGVVFPGLLDKNKLEIELGGSLRKAWLAFKEKNGRAESGPSQQWPRIGRRRKGSQLWRQKDKRVRCFRGEYEGAEPWGQHAQASVSSRGGLSENDPYRLIYVDAQSPVGWMV